MLRHSAEFTNRIQGVFITIGFLLLDQVKDKLCRNDKIRTEEQEFEGFISLNSRLRGNGRG